MRERESRLGRGAVILAAAVLALSLSGPTAAGGAKHVRWDIISLGVSPLTLNPGGFAEAKAPDGTKIRLTGSGTFRAPGGSNKGSSAVTGGGAWTTFAADGTTFTASGTYTVKELVTFEFANFQSATPVFVDNIGDADERANGTAVLVVEFSDGTQGVLTVGCHGPGAPDGIFEGISVTKGFKTYDDVQAPVPGVDANRTVFHVPR